jgi:hypothetical protein
VTDRVNGRAERGFRARIGDVCQPVVNPQSIAPGSNQTGAPQVGKMTGDRRLWEPQGLMDVADADLAICQDAEYPEPRGVSQRPVHVRKFVNPRHKYALTNISRAISIGNVFV